MDSRIRIKMGQIEVEYEGSETFLRDELPKLLEGVVELHREQFNAEPETSDGVPETGGSNGKGSSSLEATTATLAAKLGVKTESDLVIAAAARLTLVLKKESFSRADLLKEMQSAKSYYKRSYVNNLSKCLLSLQTADRLRETSKEVYALSAKELGNLEIQVAS